MERPKSINHILTTYNPKRTLLHSSMAKVQNRVTFFVPWFIDGENWWGIQVWGNCNFQVVFRKGNRKIWFVESHNFPIVPMEHPVRKELMKIKQRLYRQNKREKSKNSFGLSPLPQTETYNCPCALPLKTKEEPASNIIAEKIGDTFIDFHHLPPIEQWERIFYLLNRYGFSVINQKG